MTITRMRGASFAINRPLVARAMGSALGRQFLRPWFDTLTLRVLDRLVLPSLRGWAAASAAEGDPDRFWAELPWRGAWRPRSPTLAPALRSIDRARRAAAAANAQWESIAFAAEPHDAETFRGAEFRRRRAATRWRASASLLLPVIMTNSARRMVGFSAGYPTVRFEIPDPQAVEQRHGARLADPTQAFIIVADVASVEASHPLVVQRWRRRWIRWPAAGRAFAGSYGWALITEPADGHAVGSIVFANGLAIETDHLPPRPDPATGLAVRGLRVVEIEPPWHGRRLQPGRYAAEPILATAPNGPLDLLEGLVPDLGLLISWCRAQPGEQDAPVGLLGISLGSLAAQLVLSVAPFWQPSARPDAALLVVPGTPLSEIAMTGALPRAFGLDRALSAAGWTTEMLRRWTRLSDPDPGALCRPGAVSPDRIMVLLGTHDDVTGYARGLALADTWAVPEANRMVRARGHYTAAFALLAEPEPLERLLHLMGIRSHGADLRRG